MTMQYQDTSIDYVHRCHWAGNDDAGDLSQPRQPGVAEASTELGADQPATLPLRWVLARWVAVVIAAGWGACLITTAAPLFR